MNTRSLASLIVVVAGISISLILAGPASAGFLGVKVVGKPNQVGISTFNVYAIFDRPGEDFLNTVAGIPGEPLIISVIDGTFYQNFLGSDLAPDAFLITAFPDLEFDSFVTIGTKTDDPNAGLPDKTGLAPGWPGFGLDTLTCDDCAWFVTPLDIQGDPFDETYDDGGPGGQKLIGQFSTLDGTGIEGIVLLQGVSNGDPFQAYVAFSSVSWACCFPNGACGDILPQDCVKFGGTPQGADSVCASSGCSACPSDLDGNGEVRVPDLIKLLADWGTCPDPVLAVCTEATNDCCTDSGPEFTLGCNNSACCECICACDPTCCDQGWDFFCAGDGFVGDCGASNPNSGCADVCSECIP